MKAIILAAGEGTRLRPLTFELPKAMVEVFGKPLLAHNMDKLLAYVDEFIIVVKYKEEIIRKYFGENYKGVPVRYHTQGDKKGTAGALEHLDISGDIFILASDTIFYQSDIDILTLRDNYCVLAKQVKNPEKYGILKTSDTNILQEIIEKPQTYVGNLASLFYFKVSSELVKLASQTHVSPRGEYELIEALNVFVKNKKVEVLEIKNDFIDITSLDDLARVHDFASFKLGDTRYIENIGDNELFFGISEEHIADIICYTQDQNDVALQKNTSDSKRFSSKETLQKWYSDAGRRVFSLVSSEGKLLGISYFRPSAKPDIIEVQNAGGYEKLQFAEHTSTAAIRLYPLARGKGIASEFLSISERVYRSEFSQTVICVDIEEENIASQKCFEKNAYICIGYGENKKSVANAIHRRRVYIK